MSPWPPEQLEIFLCPDRVTVRSLGRRLALRASNRAAAEPQTLCFEAAAGIAPWQPALTALESFLPATTHGKAVGTLILSNQFMRYGLVPWRAELAGEEEHLSYARLCLAKIYGRPGRPWAVRLSRQAPGLPGLASAVDTELLESLKVVCGRARVRAVSIQPHLMRAFNVARRGLQRCSAWIALLEPGHVCLAHVEQGHWRSIRCQRFDGPWGRALVEILARESYLSEQEVVPREVHVGMLGGVEPVLPEPGHWHFHALGAAPRDADAPLRDASLAVAAAG